jgi:competence protein ComEC
MRWAALRQSNWAELLAAQTATAVLWMPVGLTFGIWFYFALPREPGLWLAALSGGAAGLCLYRAHGRLLLVLMGAVLLGLALAQLRTALIATPLIRATTDDVLLTGVVWDIEKSAGKRLTLVVAPEIIEGFPEHQLPVRLKLSSTEKFGHPAIGDRIAAKVRLAPLPGPVAPGAFDYGRQLFFESIGGTGRVVDKTQVIGRASGSLLWQAEALADLRRTIGDRITQTLTSYIASVAEAMITGERAAIPREVNRSLQISGLAHILSISGLHMSLAAGSVFWLVRAFLALFPGVAQRYPIKKWAAAAALLFGFIYMLLAGSAAATQRSYIMLAVVFFAILVDRPAISVRNLAIAAIIILVLQPESATQASFQMSFMAVMGLTSFFEYWNRPQKEEEFRQTSGWTRFAGKAWRITLASILTSVIAGGLSSIPAAYHFGRLAPYGVLANGLAIPVISLIVMPAAMFSVILMPLGLESLPLLALGKGLELVMVISDWVAGLPGAQHLIPQLPVASAILLSLAAALLCLTRGAMKATSLVALLAAIAVLPLQKPPDLYVERTAANVAFRNEAGELVFANPRRGKFAAEKWLQMNGDEASFKQAAARPGWLCDDTACLTEVKGRMVAFLTTESDAIPACDTADIVIASFPLRHRCPHVKLRLDRFDVWRSGAHALYLDETGPHVQTAAAIIGARPWRTEPEARKRLIAKGPASTYITATSTGAGQDHE